jgi:hypothetical protein
MEAPVWGYSSVEVRVVFGFWLMPELTHLLGGRIEVLSELGEGSCEW